MLSCIFNELSFFERKNFFSYLISQNFLGKRIFGKPLKDWYSLNHVNYRLSSILCFFHIVKSFLRSLLRTSAETLKERSHEITELQFLYHSIPYGTYVHIINKKGFANVCKIAKVQHLQFSKIQNFLGQHSFSFLEHPKNVTLKNIGPFNFSGFRKNLTLS